ncbi:MAG TPA: DUF3566 domain-containing protein [Aeromicrobium sp.]|nr:DUF3566 domain-containing protein [Aeromicrobium sp.]
MSLFRRGKDSVDVPALSKRDYAHTMGDSPDSTSLIPAIKEDPNGDERGEPTEAIAPVPARPMPEPPPVPAAVPATSGSHGPTIRGRTGLRLVRVEPYSVTRLAFVVSVALMIVTTVAAASFWMVLSITGVWSEINQNVAALLSDDSASFDIRDYLGFTRMVGGTLIVSGINVILMTALATVGAHLFNLAAALLGGVEATFTDD